MRIALALGVLVGSAAMLVIAANAMLARQRDPVAVPPLARSEAEAQVAGAGETVEMSVPAFRRRWWDYFQPTRGVLIATERRLVFVGIVPEPVARPVVDEPPPIERISFSLDSAVLTVRRGAQGGRGIAISTPDGDEEFFGVHPRAWAQAESLMVFASAIQRRHEAELEAARVAREQAEVEARSALYHVVERGETLIAIAARYGLTTDSLRRLNERTGTQLRVGDSLLVRPELTD